MDADPKTMIQEPTSPAFHAASGSASSGWDIRIQCTVCNTRSRRHRNDHPGKIGDAPKATLVTVCHVCASAAGYPRDEVRTLHFIDYATDEELRSDES